MEADLGEFKIAGACTLCDAPCFEIMQVYEPHERLAGEPKRLGPPLPGAQRIAFKLLDGSTMDLTFCKDCASSVSPNQYVSIWQKVLRSWARELSEKPEAEQMPDWYKAQFSNGILSRIIDTSWTDLTNG